MDIKFAGIGTESFDQDKINGVYTWTKGGINGRAAEATLKEKLKLERIESVLTEKTEQRSPRCWERDCPGTPVVWVREVQFDLKEERADINQQIVSSDYSGPVPGFCIGHTASAPARLAERVYFDRPEMQFGLRPSRWWILYTDGTKTGGACTSLSVVERMPVVREELTRNT